MSIQPIPEASAVPGVDICQAAAPLLLVFRDAEKVKAVTAYVGEQLLFPLHRIGAELAAICGGKGACGTCRVHIASPWRERVPKPLKREVRLLEYLGAVKGDRLACRIMLTADLGNLEIHSCPQENRIG
jgi:2Fe-2S ferredoxin